MDSIEKDLLAKSRRSVVVVVPFDTSDTIDLSHLDVIPMQYVGGAETNVDLDSFQLETNLVSRCRSQRAGNNSTTKTDEERNRTTKLVQPTRSVSVRPLLDLNSKTRIILRKHENSEEPTKVEVPPSFDRHGMMTRVTVDYTQDSENSESLKHFKGRKRRSKSKYNQSQNRSNRALMKNFLNSSECSNSSRVSVPDPLRVLNSLAKDIQNMTEGSSSHFEEIAEETSSSTEEHSEALKELSTALQQLEDICNHEVFTKPPTAAITESHNCTSALTHVHVLEEWLESAGTSGLRESPLSPAEQLSNEVPTAIDTKCNTNCNATVDSAFSQINSKQSGFDQTQTHQDPLSGLPSENQEPVEQRMVTDQKTADIWDWVSQKESPESLSWPHDEGEANKILGRQLPFTADQERRTSVSIGVHDVLSFGDHRVGARNQELSGIKAVPHLSDSIELKDIERQVDELPLTPKSLLAPITAVIGNLFQVRERGVSSYNESTWRMSPIYKLGQQQPDHESHSSDGDGSIKETSTQNSHPSDTRLLSSSNCSLVPAVNSTPLVADSANSDDEMSTRKSSVSSYSDLNDDMLIAELDEHDQQLLLQYEQNEERRRRIELFLKHTQGRAPQSLLTGRDGFSPQFHDLTAYSMEDRLPLHYLNWIQRSVAAQELNNSSRLKSKKSELSLKKKAKRKKKSGKKIRTTDGNFDDMDQYPTTSSSKSEKRTNIDYASDLITLQSYPIKPLETLKSSLPRTPGGKYDLESKSAEKAIASYVRAELETYLRGSKSTNQLKPRSRNSIPKSPRVVSSPPGDSSKPKPRSQIPREKFVVSEPLRVKKPTVNVNNNYYCSYPPSILSRSKLVASAFITPKQSNRVNFLRYQQQSFLAMLNAAKGKKPILETTKLAASKDSDDQFHAKGSSTFNCSSRFRTNRNTVTVVFDKPGD